MAGGQARGELCYAIALPLSILMHMPVAVKPRSGGRVGLVEGGDTPTKLTQTLTLSL